jgi:FtsH-binding integral membrane protein
MSSETPTMKSIWYFVGLMLLVMGGLVLLAGLIELVSPSPRQTVLAEIHPGIWWGAVMVTAGIIFFVRNRK